MLLFPTLVAAAEQGSRDLPALPLTKVLPSLSFTYPFSQYRDAIIPGWQYGGALRSASLINDYLMLTPPSPNALGWIWSSRPVSLKAWEADLEFHIGGSNDRGAGGGLAFWFTSEQGRAGPIYGQGERYNGLGIFFDTFESGLAGDAPEPFVVAMMNYGESLVQSKDPDYYKNQVGVCFAGYRNLNHSARARIIKTHDRLQVWLDLDHSGHFQNCIQTDVGDPRLKMPETGYFGITASTGLHGDAHVVPTPTSDLAFPAPSATRGAQVPADLLVKSEGRHHEIRVPVGTHGPTLDDQGRPMRSASSDEAEPAMVPPSADSTLELHDKLTAVVDTLRSVASKTSETESTVEKIASDMRIHVVLELMQSFASLKEELRAMNSSLVQVLETQHQQTRLHNAYNPQRTETMGSRENLDLLITKSKSNEKSMENLISTQAKAHHNIEKIENTITSVAKQVADLSGLFVKMQDELRSAQTAQTEGKQALARIEGQLAASQGGGGSYTALVVSAQALVVA
ncbi:MAG: hypothetical protein SGPRY_004754, partial [Prymnesium sp.]